MDKIIMCGMEFTGYHGVFEEEQIRGQKFIVDIEIYTNTKEAGQDDNLEKTINYGELYEKIRDIVENERYNLLEALAEKLAKVVLEQNRVHEVMVRIKKPQAPIAGKFDYMAVEISRGCDCESKLLPEHRVQHGQ
ncbi:MAG: 7,8-dihydroneopterin aldolase/epimerase/oxygenase [Clostridia bacterium]|nr:dihydroneopterin aldolase [Clostridiales bacterium]MDK2985356.1 7,8-dihydroneopterin aldolase/epimerase/oxygenase [Clostridia bacterium]